MMWMFLLGIVAGVLVVVFVAMALNAKNGELFGPDDLHDIYGDDHPDHG